MTARYKNIALSLLLISGLIQLCFVYFSYSAYAQTTAPETAVDTNTSRNWAGYVAESGTYTGVSGSWIVPSPSSAQNGSNATWVGIGGTDSHDLLQTGTQAIIENGEIEYTAWYEALPGLEHVIPIDVSGGDSVSASIIETSPGLWHLHMKNQTNGETFDKDVRYDSSRASAEWIEELPTGVGFPLALDQFGTSSFTSGTATVNGATVSIAGAGAHALKMANADDQIIADVSALGADGSSFTVTRTDALSDSAPVVRTRRTYYRSEEYGGSYRIYVIQGADGIRIYLGL